MGSVAILAQTITSISVACLAFICGEGITVIQAAMWDCRMCSENPFTTLFGLPGGPAGTGAAARAQSPLVQRSNTELEAIVAQWASYAHPRAKEFFPGTDSLQEVLLQLAKSAR
jgi:hypothetical protein